MITNNLVQLNTPLYLWYNNPDLKYKEFDIEYDKGTKNLKEVSSFFGSLLVNIEDSIIIDNTENSYYQYYTTNTLTSYMNGEQYKVLDVSETLFNMNFDDLKNTCHTITLASQSDSDLANNTRWEIIINAKNILREYLFLKLKQSRTFKGMKYNDTVSKDINGSIYNYIDLNMMTKYKVKNVDLYIRYESIITSDTYTGIKLKYKPQYTVDVYQSYYKVSNVNILNNDINVQNLTGLKLRYNQTKPSSTYKFDYYYIISYERI